MFFQFHEPFKFLDLKTYFFSLQIHITLFSLHVSIYICIQETHQIQDGNVVPVTFIITYFLVKKLHQEEGKTSYKLGDICSKCNIICNYVLFCFYCLSLSPIVIQPSSIFGNSWIICASWVLNFCKYVQWKNLYNVRYSLEKYTKYDI